MYGNVLYVLYGNAGRKGLFSPLKAGCVTDERQAGGHSGSEHMDGNQLQLKAEGRLKVRGNLTHRTNVGQFLLGI